MADRKRAKEDDFEERSRELKEAREAIDRQRDDAMDDLSYDDFVTDAEMEVREANASPQPRKGNKADR